MQGRTISTIGDQIECGVRLVAHHDRLQPQCTHSAEIDLAQLAAKLGADFDIVERRSELLARLRCKKCGAKGNMAIVLVARGGSSGVGGHSMSSF